MRRAVALLACVLVACTTRPATQIIVEVQAERGVRADLDVVHVVVNGGDGSTVGAPSIQRLDVRERPPRWPFTVVIAPLDRDPERRYEVVVTAEGEQPAVGERPLIARVRAISGFVPGETRILRLLLEDSCRGVSCNDDETCRAGVCGTATVDPRTLPGETSDASVASSDTPVVDGGTGLQDSSADAGQPPREETTLVASGGAPQPVSLSADGNRALIGAPNEDTPDGMQAGTARVFVRTGASWSEEATLFARDAEPYDGFGTAVSLNADGSRAVVGAPNDDTVDGADAGSARVFVRSGTTWTEEVTLVASGATLANYFGTSVSLSADASRALVGGYNVTPGGPARVFVRSGTTWREETTLLVSGEGSFGVAVSLSADGTRALVGASQSGGGAFRGTATVFSRAGATWTEEDSLVGTSDTSRFGSSVSLSGDGSRAVVASLTSPRVFNRSGAAWHEEAALLVPGAPGYGVSVSLNGDGSRALVVGGGAFIFDRVGSTWTEQARLGSGSTVSLSADGSSALVGNWSDGMAPDAARVFTLH